MPHTCLVTIQPGSYQDPAITEAIAIPGVGVVGPGVGVVGLGPGGKEVGYFT